MATTTEVRAPRPRCAEAGMDPEWWVGYHPGQCSKGCPHGLAAHICLSHCLLLDQCQDRMMNTGTGEYVGMVLGGMMKVRDLHGHQMLRVPKVLYASCETCKASR